MIMQAVGVAEDNIFKKRKEDDVRLNVVLTSMRIQTVSQLCCPDEIRPFKVHINASEVNTLS